MVSQDSLEEKAQILKALGHPTRLSIVKKLLEGERCVNDIRDLFDVTQPNISQHLNILKYSGVVNYRQKGNLRCYYLIQPDKVKKIIEALRS